jgi:hypothetical protein
MVHQNSLNQEESKDFRQERHKSKDNENPKIEPFSHGFGWGIKGKRTMKGPCIHPQQIPKRTASKIFPRKSPRKGSEIHQNGKSGRTQTSLEEPRQIIYTP